MSLARVLKLLAVVAIVSFAVVLFVPLAEAQCSMCRAALSGSNTKFIRNFNIAVLVLLVPPVAMFCSIFVVLRRYKLEDEDGEEK